jgi:hypothetical protein
VPASLICHEGMMNNRTSFKPNGNCTSSMPSKFYQYSDQAMDSDQKPLHDWSELHYLLDALRCAAHPPASTSQSIRNISISKEKHHA